MPIGATGIGSGLGIETLVSQLVLQKLPCLKSASQSGSWIPGTNFRIRWLEKFLVFVQGFIVKYANLETYQAKAISSSAGSKISASASSKAQSGEYALTVSNLVALNRKSLTKRFHLALLRWARAPLPCRSMASLQI